MKVCQEVTPRIRLGVCTEWSMVWNRCSNHPSTTIYKLLKTCGLNWREKRRGHEGEEDRSLKSIRRFSDVFSVTLNYLTTKKSFHNLCKPWVLRLKKKKTEKCVVLCFYVIRGGEPWSLTTCSGSNKLTQQQEKRSPYPNIQRSRVQIQAIPQPSEWEGWKSVNHSATRQSCLWAHACRSGQTVLSFRCVIRSMSSSYKRCTADQRHVIRQPPPTPIGSSSTV